MNENQNANMSRKEYNKLQAKQIGNSSSVFDGKEFLLRLASIELQSGSTTIWDLPDGYIFKDENGNVINATKIVLEKKKKEYPKTYEECCKVLDIEDRELVFNGEYRASKLYWKQLGRLNFLNKLLICRDAYWKIAGEEMGLGKPWEPDWREERYIIYRNQDDIIRGYRAAGYVEHHIFEFPTEEMRDAFYENFKELINECKELL